ncbi:MAG: rhomboid family intramembrane serine protease [Acidimicrobiales bacterium]|nr:rhomboid family intramembrane serine protease [Acidimicrobiales bacterium]
MIPLKDENPTHRRPAVTLAIIMACVVVYFFWQPSPFQETVDDLDFALRRAAIPCEIAQGEPLTVDELRATYRLGRDDACDIGSEESPQAFPAKSVLASVFVSMFLHGSVSHLGGNLLFLWIFGNNIEDHLGHVRYLLFYLVGGVAATATYVALNLDSTIGMVGASGAIAAVMGAYFVWFPDAPVRTWISFLLFVFVRIRAKWVLGFWFILQFFTAPDSGVAWAAHVGGFVFGVLIGLVVRASRTARRAIWGSTAQQVPPGGWDPTGGVGYGHYGSYSTRSR